MSTRKPAERYRRRLEALNRRADFLIERIEQRNGNNADFDKSELGAIVWAINIIEENPELALNTLRLEAPKEKETND